MIALCVHHSTEQQVHLHISYFVISTAAANQAYLYYSHQNQNTVFLINQIMEKNRNSRVAFCKGTHLVLY